MLYISTSKIVWKCIYLYTSYNNRVNIHGYYSSSIYYFINFLFASFFFSLSSPCSTNSVTSPLLIFFFFLRCSQTHPHTNTSTQINQHKDTQTHPHTNKPTRTNQQRDKSVLIRTIGAWSVLDWNDRSSWVLLDRS